MSRLLVVSGLLGFGSAGDVAQADEPLQAAFHYTFLRDARNGKTAVYPVPARAAGFDHVNKRLAVWFGNTLAFLDASNGKELGRLQVRMSSEGTVVPQIAFDPTSRYCCIARRWAQPNPKKHGFEIIVVDVQRRLASESIAQESTLIWSDGNYNHKSTNLPLRQILSIEMPDDPAIANCEVTFPASADQDTARNHFYVSLFGNREIPHVAAADRAYQMIADANKLKIERNERGGLLFGQYRVLDQVAERETVKRQVALSSNGQTLLTQRVREGNASPPYTYFFAFYDVYSRQRIAEICWSTDFYWRSYGYRGFAFSPDLMRVAVMGWRGGLRVYELSSIATGQSKNPEPLFLDMSATPRFRGNRLDPQRTD